ncbi:hypothetical protein NCAS_0B07180 [Naumovozyma castellii]|uniref:Uncharacterized protein n=1 Tax=Naumovozyma castellii TaxID=27288 RepID=G0VA72_NAUCA|nr:hypothetical protein NCAS_0B07180 [Naumovozyma castellii CBS 4309]CCC68802.1 hypothetical protein NCAS_0B07180 [Naumovozyma castellii CBS 4309]
MGPKKANKKHDKKKKSSQGNIKTMASTDSISTLTKPALYSLYSNDVLKSNEDKTSQLYKQANLNRLRRKGGDFMDSSSEDLDELDEDHTDVDMDVEFNGKWYVRLIHLTYSFFILFTCGIVFGELAENLFDNDKLYKGMTAVILEDGVKLIDKVVPKSSVTNYIGFGIEGILLSLVLRVSDYLIRPNKDKIGQSKKNSFRSIVRISNAILGISLGVRRLPWTSSLQGSMLWLLVNVIVWLFFDGTLSILTSGVIQALLICLTYSRGIETSQTLYLINFHFLGLLIFGKLSRYLFK